MYNVVGVHRSKDVCVKLVLAYNSSILASGSLQQTTHICCSIKSDGSSNASEGEKEL